jgi:hypothetical protein
MKLQIQFQPTGARIAGGDKEDVDLLPVCFCVSKVLLTKFENFLFFY